MRGCRQRPGPAAIREDRAEAIEGLVDAPHAAGDALDLAGEDAAMTSWVLPWNGRAGEHLEEHRAEGPHVGARG